MKQIMTIFMAFVLLTSVVFAQETTATRQRPGDAIVPGDALYGLDRAIENVQLFFAFSPEAKAELKLKFMDERIDEIETLEEDSDPDDDAITELAAELEDELQEVDDLSNDIEDSEERGPIQERIKEHSRYQIEVLNRVRTRIMEDENENNDNALEGLDRAIENAEREEIKVRVKRGEADEEDLVYELGRDDADDVLEEIENEKEERIKRFGE